MEMEIIAGVWIYSSLCVLALATYHKKKRNYLRDVLSDKEADIVILEQRLDGFNQKLKKAHLDLKYRSMEYKVLGDQIAAIKEVLGDG